MEIDNRGEKNPSRIHFTKISWNARGRKLLASRYEIRDFGENLPLASNFKGQWCWGSRWQSRGMLTPPWEVSNFVFATETNGRFNSALILTLPLDKKR